FGKKVRDIIAVYGKDCFGIELDHKSKAAAEFGIEGHSGGMFCTGAGGSLTGRGAELFIIDDPIKNNSEANSPVIRDKIWEWFKATVFTRLEKDGAMIVIMTRWHEDDLCGRINNNDNIITPDIVDNSKCLLPDLKHKNDWLLLSLPAIAETGDLLGRQPGEPLWKQRFPLNKLLDIKNTIGIYWFSALYQQKPSADGKEIFKRRCFKYFTEDPNFYYLEKTGELTIPVFKSTCNNYATVDLAVSLKETADYTAIIIFAVTEKHDILILEVIRERFEGAEHLNLIRQIHSRFQTKVIGIESVQYQLNLVQNGLHAGLPVKALKPGRNDKLSRALPMQARLDSGTVYFKRDSHWLWEFEDELLKFPNAAHDDQVDAFSYIAELIQPISGSLPVGSGIRKRINF
ncbi:MAG: Terminase protein, partial [Bacteroidota bacterium]|nr:Terminase protein [Bacteroidota bacterium]